MDVLIRTQKVDSFRQLRMQLTTSKKETTENIIFKTILI